MHIVQTIYNVAVRPFLPKKIGVMNGVPVRNRKLLDQTDVDPNYEEALVKALRENVTDSDEIVVVGGGVGVSTVIGARHADHVTVFEAGDRYETLCETVKINNVSESVDARRALVGPDISVTGTTANQSVDPEDLPECDILELDCEGAELAILRNLQIRPRTIIVESHGVFDAPATAVREKVTALGYSVENQAVVNEDKGVFVITAEYDDPDDRTPNNGN